MLKMADLKQSFWSIPPEDILKSLGVSKAGLTGNEAKKRLMRYGPNSMKLRKSNSAIGLLLSQFKSPIIIILLIVIVLSFFLH
jgi:Mg2+-importing ATPase